MRLGVCSFISDILSTSSNICFCWTEGKVESNLFHLHRPAAVLRSKASAAGLRASGCCWGYTHSYLTIQCSCGLLWIHCSMCVKHLLCVCVCVCRNLSLLSKSGLLRLTGWVEITLCSYILYIAHICAFLCVYNGGVLRGTVQDSYLVHRGYWGFECSSICQKAHYLHVLMETVVFVWIQIWEYILQSSTLTLLNHFNPK